MEELLGFRYCPVVKDYVMELRNSTECPKEQKRDTKEMSLRLKDISRPKVRKAVHKNMMRYHNNMHYENIDIIKKILKKLKVNPKTSEINTIRNEVKKWLATNLDKKDDDSKKGILNDEKKLVNNDLKETTVTEVKPIIPPVPPPLCISCCRKKEPILIDLTLEDVKEEKDDKQQQIATDDDDMHAINAVLSAHELVDDNFMRSNVGDVDHSANFPQEFYYPQVQPFFNPYYYEMNPFMFQPFYYSYDT